jgi:outer membrane protein assembly factor BamD
MRKSDMKIYNYLLILLLALFAACSSSVNNRDLEMRDRYELAKKQIKDGDYEKAIENLKVIAYERGSGYADSVQYYLGECYFGKEQYLLAASEYRDLLKIHPNSKISPEARYKIALSYSMISPKPMLDQNYTAKAITEFQNFIEFYPTHPRVREAEKKMIELRNILAKKEYDIASLYETMGKYRAAIVYFQGVLDKYHDSDYADLAAFGIISMDIQLKKDINARNEIDKFLQKYPNSTKKDEVISLKKSLQK